MRSGLFFNKTTLNPARRRHDPSAQRNLKKREKALMSFWTNGKRRLGNGSGKGRDKELLHGWNVGQMPTSSRTSSRCWCWRSGPLSPTLRTEARRHDHASRAKWAGEMASGGMQMKKIKTTLPQHFTNLPLVTLDDLAVNFSSSIAHVLRTGVIRLRC